MFQFLIGRLVTLRNGTLEGGYFMFQFLIGRLVTGWTWETAGS